MLEGLLKAQLKHQHGGNTLIGVGVIIQDAIYVLNQLTQKLLYCASFPVTLARRQMVIAVTRHFGLLVPRYKHKRR